MQDSRETRVRVGMGGSARARVAAAGRRARAQGRSAPSIQGRARSGRRPPQLRCPDSWALGAECGAGAGLRRASAVRRPGLLGP